MTQATSQGSTSRRVAGAAIIMMVAILASRLLGLVRNAIISYRLGQGAEADVYAGAFQIPDLLFYLIAGGALSSAFIPVFTEAITQGRESDAWHVFSTVATVMFVVVGSFVVAGEVFATPLVKLVNPGFSAEKLAATIPLTRIVLPAQICFFLGGVLMGTQYARQRFLIPALGPVVYNVGIIAGGLLLAPTMGAAGFCWGALAGAVAGNLALQWWAVSRAGMRFKPSFDWRHPAVMKVWRLMLPVVFGVALPQVGIWINRAFASKLGDGPMAALTNANQMMQVPLGIFAQAMAVAVFPTLSAQAALKQWGEMRQTASSGIRSLLFLTIPSSVLMAVLAVPVVQLLLQQGKFGPEDTSLAASVLVMYCIGIFAWSAESIAARGFYALHDTVTPVVVGTVVTVLFVPLNWLFAWPMGMGAQGLALATSVAATGHVIAMAYLLGRRLGGLDTGRMLVSISRTSAASAVAGGVAWFVRDRLTGWLGPAGSTRDVKVDAMAQLVLAGGAGCLAYVAAAAALGMSELREARSLLRRRGKAKQTAQQNETGKAGGDH